MQHFGTSTHFTAAQPVTLTVFHANGSRSIQGEWGTVTYDEHGNATLVAHIVPSPHDHLRMDLD